MYDEAKQLVNSGLKDNTHKTYTSAQRQYVKFCERYSLNVLPASEDQLLAYVAHLNKRDLSHSTVSVYLAAVRSLHVTEGYSDPLKDCQRLARAVRGVAITHQSPKQKLPITFNIMSRIIPYTTSTYDSYMMWTAMNLAYFGLLRASEYCVTTPPFNNKKDLRLCDVSMQNNGLIVNLKCSKTDKCNNGVEVYIGCSENPVCAVCTMSNYLCKRETVFSSDPESPLFLFTSGTPLTRSLLCNHIKLCIATLGFNPDNYSGHSLRAGGATDAAKNGLADWEIKFLGRWTSNAYLRYIRLPPEFKAGLARRMIDN